MKSKMTLKEFRQKVSELSDLFFEEWESSMENAPKHFPESM